MLKLWAFVLATLFTPQTQVVDLGLANKLLSQSVLVRVKMYNVASDGRIQRAVGGCSGTYIGPQLVLTAAHCFSAPVSNVWIRGYGTVSREAKLVKIDVSHDLALVSVKGPYRHAVAKLGNSVVIGQKVINVGSPFGIEFLLSEGIIARTELKHPTLKSNYLVTTAMINPGSSGGGAFNEKGELIGVNTMTVGSMFGWAGISLAVSLYDIKEFLR